jgi:hypothetical protein
MFHEPLAEKMNEQKGVASILTCHSARVKNRPVFFKLIPAMLRHFASFLPIELLQPAHVL